jgi:hypothetical protein
MGPKLKIIFGALIIVWTLGSSDDYSRAQISTISSTVVERSSISLIGELQSKNDGRIKEDVDPMLRELGPPTSQGLCP